MLMLSNIPASKVSCNCRFWLNKLIYKKGFIFICGKSLTAITTVTLSEKNQLMHQNLLTLALEERSSSVVAGVVSTLITAPMDMIKTRLMLQQDSESTRIYRNGFHCGYKVMQSSPSLIHFHWALLACLC